MFKFLLILLTPILSFLNRERGADRFPKSDTIAKVIVGVMLSVLMFIFSPMITLSSGWLLLLLIAPTAGYIFGESMGWGKWVGGIISQGTNPEYDKKQGDENGVHWLTSQIVDQHDNYLNYCRLALLFRGIVWWFPALAPLLIVGCFGGWIVGPIKFIIGMAMLGAGFPASVEIARVAFLKIKNKDELGFTDGVGDGNFVWEWAEWIYGGIHGLVLMLLLI